MIQAVLNSLVSASWIALVAIGFMLIFHTTHFFHFAHGVVFTGAAYLTLLFNKSLGLPLSFSLAFAIMLSAFLGCLMDILVYRPLRHRDAPPLVMLLASLGLYVIFQNVIALVFGNETRTIRFGMVQEGIEFLGGRITTIQVLTACVSAALLIAVWIMVRKTKVGMAMLAVANNPELASLSGIEVDRVILYAFAIGSLLAGVAGVLVALDVDMTPTMGMNALMMAVVAVMIGGIGSVPGVALGALLLGMARHIGVLKIGSQWQDAIAFVILLIFLLMRPEGVLGKKTRKATV